MDHETDTDFFHPTTTTTTTTILYLTTLHLGAKKRSLKHVRAKTMYTMINDAEYKAKFFVLEEASRELCPN